MSLKPTKLYYNNQEILPDYSTPILGKKDSMVLFGERWCDLTSITLKGQITGNQCAGFLSLLSGQQELLNVFSKDFQSFVIIDQNNTGNPIYSYPYSIIRNVSFPSSKYVGILNYEVNLDCYDQNLFSGFYGVLDPVDSWDFEATNDYRLKATHTIAARGFNTVSGQSNALNNAISFIAGRTGTTNFIQPYFINVPSGFIPCLKTYKEDINRFNATYKVTETYEGDLFFNQGGVIRFGTDYTCNSLNGIATVSVDGEILPCLKDSISDTVAKYNNLNLYQLALSGYQEATNFTRSDLNPDYISSGLTEDIQLRKITFKAEFDNWTGASLFFDYKSVVNSGENDIISVGVDGTIGARGDIFTRWARVSGYYNTLNLFSYASTAYTNFVGGGYPYALNPFALSSGVTFNQFIGEIKVNGLWDNRPNPVLGFATLDYTLNFTPALEKVVTHALATNSNGAICSALYYTVDLGYKNRCIFGMNGNGKVVCGTNINTAITNLKTFANTQFTNYCPNTRPYLEVNNITTGFNTVNFTFTWSAESSNNVVQPQSNYTNINQLSLL